MGRKYRRRKSTASSIIGDIVHIGSKLPWCGALIFGILSFSIFYFAVPYWLEIKLSESSGSVLYPAFETIFGRRIHWFQWLGIACGLVCLYFTVRNYIFHHQAGYQERGVVAFLVKLVSRKID